MATSTKPVCWKTEVQLYLFMRFRECVYTGKSVTMADIRYEQACVLYNVGALHSILGALDNRQSPEVGEQQG